MSMYDFNQEEDQKNRISGPIAAGSSVLVRLALRRPKFPYEASGIVGTTQKGMLFLGGIRSVLGTIPGE